MLEDFEYGEVGDGVVVEGSDVEKCDFVSILFIVFFGYFNWFFEVVDVVIRVFFLYIILIVFGNNEIVLVVGVYVEVGNDMMCKVIFGNEFGSDVVFLWEMFG